MKKIAIVGAHGVGKTTLAKALSQSLDLPLVPDFAALAFHKGFRVNEQTTIENQFWMLANQIEHERKLNTSYIADKAILDNIVYSKYLFDDFRALSLIQDIVLKNTHYTHYIYLPIEFTIEADGRSLDTGFQKQINDDYLDLLNKLQLQYTEIRGDVQSRLNQVLKILI